MLSLGPKKNLAKNQRTEALSNFWRALNISLINCEIELIFPWCKNCVLAYMTTTDAEADSPKIIAPSGVTFKMRKQDCMFQLLLCQRKIA